MLRLYQCNSIISLEWRKEWRGGSSRMKGWRYSAGHNLESHDTRLCSLQQLTFAPHVRPCFHRYSQGVLTSRGRTGNSTNIGGSSMQCINMYTASARFEQSAVIVRRILHTREVHSSPKTDIPGPTLTDLPLSMTWPFLAKVPSAGARTIASRCAEPDAPTAQAC